MVGPEDVGILRDGDCEPLTDGLVGGVILDEFGVRGVEECGIDCDDLPSDVPQEAAHYNCQD